MKVLYIAGWQRSGTTIIDNVLGEQPAFFAGGEIGFAWESHVRGRLCGCGQLVSRCEIWAPVLADVLRECEVADIRDAAALKARLVRVRTAATLATPVLRRRHEEDLERYACILGATYRGLGRATGASVIVDSSKHANVVLALGRAHGIDPYYVHVVRNPERVAESETGEVDWEGVDANEYPPRRTAFESASLWLATNLTIELWRRRGGSWIHARYEDWASDPMQTTARLVEALGEPFDPASFVDDATIRLGGNHTLAGNPGRFRTGEVRIGPRHTGRAPLSRRDSATVKLLTLPLSRRYGYS